MMNFEIEREAMIEVVGTQYEERSHNHIGLGTGQKLLLHRQPQNEYDSNAIIVSDKNNRPLGFLPKGQAALYASAMDSGKYSFEAEVANAEYDVQRPILIIRIVAEYKNLRESEVLEQIHHILQNVINGFESYQSRYQNFITDEVIDNSEVISCLYTLRLLRKMIDLSQNQITENHITANHAEFIPFSKKQLLAESEEIRNALSELMKKYQRLYNETGDIEDEEEYQRVSGEIRKKRKKFKELNAFCESLIALLHDFSDIQEDSEQEKNLVSEEPVTEIPEAPDSAPVTQTDSAVQTEPSHMQEKSAPNNTIYRLDLNQLDDCTGKKPCQFSFRGDSYPVKSWSAIYKKLIITLYHMNEYQNLFKKYIGCSLLHLQDDYIDFANDNFKHLLRRPFAIVSGFYIEINLSTKDILRRIQRILNICDIPYQDVEILYTDGQDNEETELIPDSSPNEPQTQESPAVPETPEEETVSPEPTEEPEQNFNPEISIIEILRQNKDNIYYRDGFDAYKIKYLLPEQIGSVLSVQDIEQILKSSSQTKEIETGCYVFDDTPKSPPQEEKNPEVKEIILELNHHSYNVYGWSEALIQICEFAIRSASFRMAKIHEADVTINGERLFYRSPAPLENYYRLSNRLQVLLLNNHEDVVTACYHIFHFCGINTNLLRIQTKK